MLKTKNIIFITTLNCSLNCKYCGSAVPRFREAGISYFADINETKDSITALFDIYDHIEHIDFSGGEPLLWSDGLAECLLHLQKFSDKFGFARILTNGTILPNEKLLSVIGSLGYKFDFFIDNYGPLSSKVEQIKELLTKNGINFRETIYAGDHQDFGGWIDFGDYSLKERPPEMLDKIYRCCLQAQHMCLTVLEGKLYNCTVAPVGYKLGKIPEPDRSEYVDLLNGSDISEKRRIACGFGSHILEACRYCNGFDSENAPRFPAAEQA